MKGRTTGESPPNDGIASRFRDKITGGGHGFSINFRGVLAVFMVAMLAAQFAVAPAAAAGPDLNFDDDRAPNPYLHENEVTISQYNKSVMSDPLAYYADDGDVKQLPATYNASQEEPFTFRADKIADDDLHQFPRNDDSSVMNASDWTTQAGTGDSITVKDNDGASATGVESLNITGSAAADTTTNATFSNFTNITSDADKRVFRFVGSVKTLDSSAMAKFVIIDDDGDQKEVLINSSKQYDSDNVVGNATGDGYVYQERLGDLTTQANGDGTFDSIAKIQVQVNESTAEIHITGLDVEPKSEFTLGEQIDSDGDTVTVTERNSGGDMSLSVTSLDTMDSMFDDAVVNDYKVSDVSYRFQDLTDSDDYQVEFSDADDYGSYERKLEVHGRLEIPSAIDLSHSGLNFNDTQEFVDERHATIEIAEGVGDKDFSNISSWTDKTDTYTDEGSEHNLDGTVSDDKEYAFHGVYLITSEEEDTLTATPTAAGPVSGGGGGIGAQITGFLGTVWGKVAALVGIVASGLGLGARGE